MGNREVVIVTGASSGIGYATADLLLDNGYTVYCLARSEDKMKPLAEKGGKVIKLDVSDMKAGINTVHHIRNIEGRIDVLVNCAGYAEMGALEDVPIDKVRHNFDVNMFGALNLTQQVLPIMRQQGKGHVVSIGSMSTYSHVYFAACYSASKAALKSYTNELRTEVEDSGIKVTLIEPGIIKTNWPNVASITMKNNTWGSYHKRRELIAMRTILWLYNQSKVSSPNVVAKAVLKTLRSRHPKAHYRVGYLHRTMFLLHFLPARLYDKAIKFLTH